MIFLFLNATILDGIHYVCATTAPRLRVSNGWKIYHYHGHQIHEYTYPTNDKNELWEVAWQPNLRTKAAEITKPSIIAQKIQQQTHKPKGYVPPHARGRKDYNVSWKKKTGKKKDLDCSKSKPTTENAL